MCFICICFWIYTYMCIYSLSVCIYMFSSVMSDFLWPHVLQHARLPCPSPTPGLTQTRIYWVGDAIQPFHPLSSPSPPALYFSQHQGLFNESALCIRWPKYWSFNFSTSFLPLNSQGWFRLELTSLMFLQSMGFSRVLSNTTVQKHQFFTTLLSL